MSLFTTIRQKPAPWTRRVFGLFVVVWLNIALQPCAMAFSDASDHGCPGCTPPFAEEVSARDSAMSYPDASMCAPSTADCTLVDDFNFGGRATSVCAKDAPSDVPVGIAPSVDESFLADYSLVRQSAGATSVLPGASPPLNILYCIYLI